LPFGRFLSGVTLRPVPEPLPPPPPPPIPLVPRRDVSQLRTRVADNPAAVASLLQSWVDDE
jgi:hypothetical protein